MRVALVAPLLLSKHSLQREGGVMISEIFFRNQIATRAGILALLGFLTISCTASREQTTEDLRLPDPSLPGLTEAEKERRKQARKDLEETPKKIEMLAAQLKEHMLITDNMLTSGTHTLVVPRDPRTADDDPTAAGLNSAERIGRYAKLIRHEYDLRREITLRWKLILDPPLPLEEFSEAESPDLPGLTVAERTERLQRVLNLPIKNEEQLAKSPPSNASDPWADPPISRAESMVGPPAPTPEAFSFTPETDPNAPGLTREERIKRQETFIRNRLNHQRQAQAAENKKKLEEMAKQDERDGSERPNTPTPTPTIFTPETDPNAPGLTREERIRRQDAYIRAKLTQQREAQKLKSNSENTTPAEQKANP